MRTRSTREQTRGRIPLAASLIGVLVVILATSTLAHAATGGRPTGNAHPAVGALVVAQPPPALVPSPGARASSSPRPSS